MDQTSATPRHSKPETGIVLIALGHPYYGHMAYNLCASIKHLSPDIPVAIIHDETAISQPILNNCPFFDIKIPIKKKHVNGRFGYDPYRVKLFLPELTPFKNTLYLDVDMIVSPVKKISDLIFDLTLKEIMFSNRGKVKIGEGRLRSEWCDLGEVKAAYNIDSVYDISSEVIWFKEGDLSKKIFRDARRIYDEYKFNVKKFGMGKPDEPFLMTSLATNKVELTPCPFHPSYWQPFYFNKMHSRDFIQGHYLLSVGGAHITANIKKIYDSISRHYFNRMGLAKAPYQLISKSRILKERSKI